MSERRRGEGTEKKGVRETLTGCATMHWVLCVRSEVKVEGIMQDVELARTTSSSAYLSISPNTFRFNETFSGVHSWREDV